MINATKANNGAWELTTIRGGYLISYQYFDYTKKQAIKLFREYLKERNLI